MESLLILLGGLTLVAIFIFGTKKLDVAHKHAEFAQALFTLAAFLATAYWFFVERKGQPHADVSQVVHVLPLGRGLIMVEAHISVKNLGERLLRLERLTSRVQVVHAAPYNIRALGDLNGDEYWNAWRSDREGIEDVGNSHFNYSELRWPIIKEYEQEVDHEIEPGETDLIVVTFVLNCQSGMDWVRVASDIQHPDASGPADPAPLGRDAPLSLPADGTEAKIGSEGAPMAWKARSFSEVREACAETSIASA
jgi:hypothetical protein